MKRLITLLVVSLVLTVGAGVAQAGKANKADKQAKKDQRVAGTVIKVDGANIVVQTRGKKGAEVTISTDANTKFEVGKNAGTIDDVKAGATVVASPANGTAEKITIRPGKGDKAKGAKGAKAAKNAA